MREPKALLDSLISLARKTGNVIYEFYLKSRQFAVAAKSDATPLTQADLIANEMITAGLKQLTPQIPVLSEEGAEIPLNQRRQWNQYWLVDPVDGTKEFIRHTGEFSINISLMSDNKPILGLIYAPVMDLLYYALKDEGSFKQEGESTPQRLQVKPWSPELTRIAAGHFYKLDKLKKILDHFGPYEIITCGSALKFGLIAEGKVDLYPRYGNTSWWDTAAGQLLVEEAGGSVLGIYTKQQNLQRENSSSNSIDLQTLRYNMQPSLLNPHFIALGDTTNLVSQLKIWLGETHD